MRNQLSRVAKLPVLRAGQRELYRLVVGKVEKDEPITLGEAKKLYIEYGCQDVRDGVPYRAPYIYNGSYSAVDYIPMDERTINLYSSGWLRLNLGSLVLKGYLKVVPTIELKKLHD